jgi:hypothetical protein
LIFPESKAYARCLPHVRFRSISLVETTQPKLRSQHMGTGIHNRSGHSIKLHVDHKGENHYYCGKPFDSGSETLLCQSETGTRAIVVEVDDDGGLICTHAELLWHRITCRPMSLLSGL